MVQTDNSHFLAKVELRTKFLPVNESIKVLDCYTGDGRIWEDIISKSKKKISVVGIEKEKGKKGMYLQGDNRKYLKTLDLLKYDVIDLDAYGMPIDQLDIIFSRRIKNKIIFVTFIQTMQGCISRKLLLTLGYTKAMIEKCPSLFNRNGFEKFKLYLANHGITEMWHYSFGNKHYCYFAIE